MLINESINDYCEHVDSQQPSPGGGSVASLVGAVACALSRMYGHFSISKKAFQQLSPIIQNKFELQFAEIKKMEKRLLELVDEDALLYPQILAAYRLPKDNEEEIQKRNIAIQAATIQAIEGPYEIAKIAFQAMIATEQLLPYGNQNVISDAACAIVFLAATVEAAIINMEVNLSSLHDSNIKSKYVEAIMNLQSQTKEKKEQLMKIAHPL